MIPLARIAARAAFLAPALLAAAFLAGCASGPARPDFLDAALKDGETSARIETSRGALALSRWPAERPRAVLLALHGYGDYGPSTYDAAARVWAARGIETYAYDQRGFGRNDSNRQWPGAAALIEDLQEIASQIKARHPDLPLFVAGHSMGGGVALAAAGEGRLDEATGLILFAPAVWGGDTLNPLLRASAWSMAQVAPDLRFSNRVAPVRLQPTDNMPMLIALSEDPLHYANPSPREFLGLIRLMDRAVEAAPEDRLDTLVVMGAHDEIVPEDSVRAAYDALPGPKEFAYAPDGWHMLLRDLNAGKVHDLTADWILARAKPAEEGPAADRQARTETPPS